MAPRHRLRPRPTQATRRVTYFWGQGLAVVLSVVLVGAAQSSASAQSDPLVDLNTASEAELRTLPGIGPVKAESIVRYRESQGEFAHPTEVMRVPGIGRRTFNGFCRQVEANGYRGCDEQGTVHAPAEATMPSVEGDGRLNINLASAEELQVLPRIGPAISQRIVAYRQSWGPFESIDALEQVSGIGPSTIDEIRAFVTVRTNLNTASIPTLERLGISTMAAEALIDYRSYSGYFDSVDELLEVPGIDAVTVEAIRPLVTVELPLAE